MADGVKMVARHVPDGGDLSHENADSIHERIEILRLKVGNVGISLLQLQVF